MLASSSRLGGAHLASVAMLGAALVVGCSNGGSGTGGAGGASDGKFHPKSDGVAIAEGAACDSLHAALEAKVTALSCTITLPTCPSFVELTAGVSCSEFDQGTIQGCAQYYGQAADCTDLRTRSSNCAFKAIAGSAPKGCPTP